MAEKDFSDEWLGQICAEAKAITVRALEKDSSLAFCLGPSASLHALLPLVGQYGALSNGGQPPFVHPSFAWFVDQYGAEVMTSALTAAMKLFPSWVAKAYPNSVWDLDGVLKRFVFKATRFGMKAQPN